MNAHDIELALRARATFNESVDRVDADTRRRLRDIRLHAQQASGRHAGARWIWPFSAAVTAAIALAVFLPRLPQAPTATVSPATVATAAPHAIAPVSTNDGTSTSVAQGHAPETAEAPTLETTDPDMLSQLDFYGWLAKQPNNGNSGG